MGKTDLRSRKTVAGYGQRNASIGQKSTKEYASRAQEGWNSLRWWLYGNSEVQVNVAQWVTSHVLEMMAAGVIGTAIVLVNMLDTTLDGVSKGLHVALAGAIPVFVFSRIFIASPLKPQLSVQYLIKSACLGEIGPLGFLIRLVTMFIGAMFAGLVVTRILMSDIVVTIINNSVPMPVTAYNPANFGGIAPAFFGVTLATTICLEIFAPIFIHVTGAFIEHVNTDSSTEKARAKNYKNARFIDAMFWFVARLVLVPFGTFSLDFAPYITGLFTGVGQSIALRTSENLIYLGQANIADVPELTNSVWRTTDSLFGSAPATYILAPMAAGAVLAGLVWLITYFVCDSKTGKMSLTQGEGYDKVPADEENGQQQEQQPAENSMVSSFVHSAVGQAVINMSDMSAFGQQKKNK